MRVVRQNWDVWHEGWLRLSSVQSVHCLSYPNLLPVLYEGLWLAAVELSVWECLVVMSAAQLVAAVGCEESRRPPSSGDAFEVASAWLLLSLCGLSLKNIVEYSLLEFPFWPN